jgi:hypothetical protein
MSPENERTFGRKTCKKRKGISKCVVKEQMEGKREDAP